MSKYDLQRTCWHPKPVTNLPSEWVREKDLVGYSEVLRMHLYCPTCGMYFCRDEWATKRPAR